MPIPTELLNLAGEYAVASQLARRCHYAQLTFGNRKRTDILVDAANGQLFRVEVKAKQAQEWPGVQPPRPGDFVILVDFQRKDILEPPDFYILDRKDWIELISAHRKRFPQIAVDDDYCVTWPDGWRGVNLKVEWVAQYRDTWDKLPGTSQAIPVLIPRSASADTEPNE